MHLIVTTVPGLEEVAAEEIAALGLRAAPLLPGRLLAPAADTHLVALVRRLNRQLRCAERVGLLLGRAQVDRLEQVEEFTRALDPGAWLGPGESFAVRGLRRGRHAFSSMQLAGAVGHAILEACRAVRGVRPAVNLDDPDAVFRAELFEQEFVLWLDTTGYDALYVRAWRLYAHMASMRPSTANLLLRLAGGPAAGTLLDPFCGGATILVEAAHAAAGVAPGAVRGRPWAWQRMRAFAPGKKEGATDSAVAPLLLRLVGVERFRRHVEGALQNVRAAGLGGRIVVHCGLAERCDELLRPGERPLWVVTNPPFGRRVASVRRVARLYREAAAAWARLRAARVVTLAERGEPMAEALEAAGFALRRRLPAVYGRTPVEVFVAEGG